MGPLMLDEHRKKRRAELISQLKELKAALQKFKAERSLPDANKLSEIEKLRPLLAEVSQKKKAALEEAYKTKCEHIYIRPNYAAASISAFSEDGEENEA